MIFLQKMQNSFRKIENKYMGGIYESGYCVKTVSLFLNFGALFETLLN